jgi:hypothetical protein
LILTTSTIDIDKPLPSSSAARTRSGLQSISVATNAMRKSSLHEEKDDEEEEEEEEEEEANEDSTQ